MLAFKAICYQSTAFFEEGEIMATPDKNLKEIKALVFDAGGTVVD